MVGDEPKNRIIRNIPHKETKDYKRLFWALKWQRVKYRRSIVSEAQIPKKNRYIGNFTYCTCVSLVAISGPKKVSIFRAHPIQ